MGLRKAIMCPACKQPLLTTNMYSEDFASVLDQTCPGCGTKHYEYIGAHDGDHVWKAFRAKYLVVDVPRRQHGLGPAQVTLARRRVRVLPSAAPEVPGMDCELPTAGVCDQ